MSTTNVNVATAHNVATTSAVAVVSNVTVGAEGNLDGFLAMIGQELSVEELEVA